MSAFRRRILPTFLSVVGTVMADVGTMSASAAAADDQFMGSRQAILEIDDALRLRGRQVSPSRSDVRSRLRQSIWRTCYGLLGDRE
jgi:hypothetical protein